MSTPLRLGIAGLGTVGRGVVKLITAHSDEIGRRCGRSVEIVAVSARDRNLNRGIDLAPYSWVGSPRALAEDNRIDVVVELIGGSEGTARELVETALAHGKHVVTANKALLALHGLRLAQIADERGVALNFEAAVAGGIPIVKSLREGLVANRVSRLYGILNGTCNYILSAMEESGRPFADVLSEAQALGYAEADPTFDISGADSAHKLVILARLAFGTTAAFEDLHVEGITGLRSEDIAFARELGYRIKLLGLAERTGAGISARVHPCLVPLNSTASQVAGVMNAVMVEADPVERTFFEGPGAGEGPTASAVVADIADIARGIRQPVFIRPAAQLEDAPLVPLAKLVRPYYVRFRVIDRPGVMAAMTGILARHGVSIESIIQRGRRPGEPVTIVMVTHETEEAVMSAALGEIGSLDSVTETPCMIRIEEV